jgi:nucleotide-binding universal stress UspA family protein
LGSVARKIIADGRVSVLVVPIEPAPNPRVRTIAVALDCSPRAECVLPLATRLAISTDAQLVLAHVVPEPDLPHRLPTSARDRELAEELTARNWARAQAYLDEIGNRLQARGVSCRVQLLSHVNPARGLEAWLEDSPIDLALLSAHGAAAGDDEAHGSVVQRLLGSLRTPLWIVQDLPPTRRAGVRRGMSGRFERV